jgi:hypothetical protein
VGAEEVLRILLALVPLVAHAEGLRQPQKLTVALSDELLGQLAPDGKRVYFLSNRNATSQVFTHDLDRPSASLLFDEGADVSWPRLAPDGKRLLYVSYRDDATGRLCVRELPSLERKCLGDSGALTAAWKSATEILLVARTSVEADLQVELVRADASKLRATPFLARNVAGIAVSPDGKWLAFVPVERKTGRLGPAFAGQAARFLVMRKLDGDAETQVRFALAGATGQPAFSPDGKWLYFTQYLNDTDQNSVLDADDHGVIFRVPFGDPAHLAEAVPEQLTSAAWNCQYPAPARERLILTCAYKSPLDVYSLPLDGLAPETWNAARIRDEIEAARNPWLRLLLTHRLARSERDRTVRTRLLEEVLRLHLHLGEYESAAEMARELESPVLATLVAHRRALRAFDRGELGQRFLDDARARLGELERTPESALRHLAVSELLDDIGDKEASARELERAHVSAQSPAFEIQLAADRAEALYRELDRPDALVDALAPLAEHSSLPEIERVRLAGVAARTIERGLPAAQADAALAKAHARFAADSPMAFRIDLLRCLPHVAPTSLDAGRACIGALYDKHSSLARRRVLVGEVLRRAELSDADDLEYELVRRWVKDVPRDSAEWPHAERRFRFVVEDYAYAALARGKASEAAAEFASVLTHGASFESEVGILETQPASAPQTPFSRAYDAIKRLADLDGPEFDRLHAAALADVKRAEDTGGDQHSEVQAVHGALLHLRWLRAQDRLAAEEASWRYQLAIDLAHDNPRYRAMLLEQLALLHAAVGNHRIALGWFDERGRLPFADPRVELGHHLTRAFSLAHVGRETEAAQAAEEGRKLIERTPQLARFAPLALDRAALYALAAGDAAHALELYDRARDGDRVRYPLARAAAALSAGKPERALDDLARVEAALRDPHVALGWPELSPEEAKLTFSLLALGLRGQAERTLGRIADATRTLAQRHALLTERAQRRDLDDDQLALALAEAQLADLADRARDLAAAARHASDSLAHADAWAKRTGTPLADAQLAVLSLAAELVVRGDARLDALAFDLTARLRDAFDRLATTRDPARHLIQRRFGVYLTLLALGR